MARRLDCHSWRGRLLSTFPDRKPQHAHMGFHGALSRRWILVSKAVAFEGPRSVRAISSLLARIGAYSYSIYLWQMFFIWRVVPHFNITVSSGVFWCFFVGPILFGIAAAKAIEIPVLRFRDRVFPPVPKSRVVLRFPPPLRTSEKHLRAALWPIETILY